MTDHLTRLCVCVPLIHACLQVSCVTRLVHQKGIHLIKHAAWRTCERGGQFVLLGSAPDPKIQVRPSRAGGCFSTRGGIWDPHPPPPPPMGLIVRLSQLGGVDPLSLLCKSSGSLRWRVERKYCAVVLYCASSVNPLLQFNPNTLYPCCRRLFPLLPPSSLLLPCSGRVQCAA